MVRGDPEIDVTGTTLPRSILEVTYQDMDGPKISITLRADHRGNFAAAIPLSDGFNLVEVISHNSASAEPRRQLLQLIYDSRPLALFVEITEPAFGATVNAAVLTVSGNTLPGARVVLNEIIPAAVDETGAWSASILLRPGANQVSVVATHERSLESTFINVDYVPEP